MSLVGCHLVTAEWDEWSTVLEMVLVTICTQRGFVEAGTTIKGSFAEDKGAKLKVKLNGLGELQK